MISINKIKNEYIIKEHNFLLERELSNMKEVQTSKKIINVIKRTYTVVLFFKRKRKK